MKKLSLALLLGVAFANADFVGASVGAGMWQENIGGYVKNNGDTNYMNKKSAETDGNTHTGNLGLSDETRPYVWAKIITPIPLIPNMKVQYTRYSTSGTGLAVGNINIFGKTISLSDRVHTTIDINSYDATFFYEFKPEIVDIETGIGVNVLDGETTVTSLTTNQTTKASWTQPIPYLYARLETMQIFGISAEGEAKYLDIGSAYYHDYQAALKYHFPTPVIDTTISVGYRYQDIYAEDGSDETELKFDGGFAELGLKW